MNDPQAAVTTPEPRERPQVERSAAFFHLLDAEAHAENGEAHACLVKTLQALEELTEDYGLLQLAERVRKAATDA